MSATERIRGSSLHHDRCSCRCPVTKNTTGASENSAKGYATPAKVRKPGCSAAASTTTG